MKEQVATGEGESEHDDMKNVMSELCCPILAASPAAVSQQLLKKTKEACLVENVGSSKTINTLANHKHKRMKQRIPADTQMLLFAEKELEVKNGWQIG